MWCDATMPKIDRSIVLRHIGLGDIVPKYNEVACQRPLGCARQEPPPWIWRYGVRPPGYYGGRYPVYGGRFPYYGGYYGSYPYYGGYYDGWGLGAGLIAGDVLGAAVASTYPVYETPAMSAEGGYCATAIRTCALINAAPVETGCSCRVQGGRARGTVVGP